MKEPPFWTLRDMGATLMIFSVLAFIVWCLGGLEFIYVVLGFILFVTTLFLSE